MVKAHFPRVQRLPKRLLLGRSISLHVGRIDGDVLGAHTFQYPFQYSLTGCYSLTVLGYGTTTCKLNEPIRDPGIQ